MCGIIGISKQKDAAALEIYNGLLMLQHRGQDAAGIVTFDGKNFFERKDGGFVCDVFQQRHIEYLRGNCGLGHVRYPTAGSLSARLAQPFFVNAPFGIYLVHNGNLTNVDFLREKIQQKYCRHLCTNSDSEILLNIFADKIWQQMKKNPNEKSEKIIFAAVKNTIADARGGFSVISIIDKIGMLGFRDSAGVRPLILGRRKTKFGDEWIFSSESVALKSLGFEVFRDVAPGEAILIQPDGKIISENCANGKSCPCIFEYVYLARPDSMIEKISVYKTQLRMGQKLAAQIAEKNLKIDSVMPVPDSSRPVALEIAQNLGIKYREGLVKNRYIGRTFIMPDQKTRKKSIRRKYNTIELEFRNRNILLVDDSIVRGNTLQQIIKICRAAGAAKIFVASASPPIKNICNFGVDIPTKNELIADQISINEIKKKIGADELFYQKIDDLIDAARDGNPEIENFCTGCFGGKYADL